MSKETFAEWLHSIESYYINSDMLEQKEDEHNVKIKLPIGITTVPNEDGSTDIPYRDIWHGEWFTNE